MKNSNLEFRKIKSLKFLYEINSNGTIVRNVKSKKQAKIILDNETGYYKVIIGLNTKKQKIYITRYIHLLVAECWLDNKDISIKHINDMLIKHINDMSIRHIDGNKRNNDYKNLCYISNIKKPVIIYNQNEKLQFGKLQFDSYSDCSKYISEKQNCNIKRVRDRLNQKRKYIYGYKVIYLLNAETGRNDSTE